MKQLTEQQKGWLERFVEMGGAAEFIEHFVLDVEVQDDGKLSNEDYGALVRAKDQVLEKVRQRFRDLELEASR